MSEPDWNLDPKALDRQIWVRGFMADRQAEADYLGMDLLDYIAESHGGILRDVVAKIRRHAEAHPVSCPPDCAMKASLKRLKKKHTDAPDEA